MIILVSPNEDREVKDALGELVLETPSNVVDFILHTNRGIIPRERKVFPQDFLASVRDGRLASQCASMREISQFPGFILESTPHPLSPSHYWPDGHLRMRARKGKQTGWTKTGIRNVIRSLKFVEGCDIEYSESIQETIQLLRETQEYFDQSSHLSLRNRPGFQSNWPISTYKERFIYFLQGIKFGEGKGISIHRATAIASKFKTPMEVFNATVEDLQIPGIGPATAILVYNFLRGIQKC